MGDCIIESSGGVLVVRFNRPESMNAMGGTLMDEFDAAMDEAELNDRVKAIVVTGEGRAWCAGADLQAAANRGAETEERHDIRARTLDRFGDIGRTVLRLQEIGKPTIAAVNGAAVGGGFGLCAGFDIRLASEKARFSTIFIKRALAPDFGLSWSLPRLVGPQVAADLFYTARMVEAQEALGLGIVLKVVPHDKLMAEALEYAEMVAKHPPSVVTLTRRALAASPENNLRDHLQLEWANQRFATSSAEFQEGVRAFLEKREPDFSKF